MIKFNKNKIKPIIYFGNYLARPVGNVLKEGLNLGNPYASIGYGFLDLINNNSDKLKKSKFNRLIKLGGMVYFSGKTILNLISITKGDFENSYNFPFNVSMAYTLGKDTFQNYSNNKNIYEDIDYIKKNVNKLEIKSFYKKISSSNKKNIGKLETKVEIPDVAFELVEEKNIFQKKLINKKEFEDSWIYYDYDSFLNLPLNKQIKLTKQQTKYLKGKSNYNKKRTENTKEILNKLYKEKYGDDFKEVKLGESFIKNKFDYFLRYIHLK